MCTCACAFGLHVCSLSTSRRRRRCCCGMVRLWLVGWVGLALFGLFWLDWLGLAWPGLAWPGLVWLGWAVLGSARRVLLWFGFDLVWFDFGWLYWLALTRMFWLSIAVRKCLPAILSRAAAASCCASLFLPVLARWLGLSWWAAAACRFLLTADRMLSSAVLSLLLLLPLFLSLLLATTSAAIGATLAWLLI